MTYSPTSFQGQAPECGEAVNSGDVGQQETALIHELRRLQKFLEHEQHQNEARYSRVVDLQLVSRFSDRPCGEGRNSPPKPVDGAVVGILHKLGLNRRNPAATSDPRGKTAVSARQSARRDPVVQIHRQPPQQPRQPTSPPIKAKPERGDAQPTARHSSEISRISPRDRIGVSLPPPKSQVKSDVIAARESLRPARLVERLQRVSTFLVGRAGGSDEKAETKLTTRLTGGFESELRAGLRVLIIGLGILGGWATFVPLSGAVIVSGTLVVESDLKKIQHPSGGVVGNIPVRDGMHVRAGDLLLHLDETQPRANAQVLAQQLDQVRVKLARLMAERDGANEPQVPRDMAGRSGDDDIGRLWTSEVSLFNSRAAARRSAKELLQSHIAQLGEQISGLDSQVKSKASQHDLISGELEGVESLYQKGLVPLARKTSLQREAARLDGERGQVTAAIAEAKSKISEAELQAVRVDQDFRTEVMKDLREAQDKEAELVEKSTAAQDLLKRVDLRAPTDGIVHQLSVHTVGGVISPGEVVMEIVPESDELQIEAKLPPQEIDHVHREQQAYVRFSAFNQRTTPQLEGTVSYVSADLTHERQANYNASYYTVRVTLPPSERRRLGELKLVSGMPAEVFLQTGSRTLVSYLLKPITDQLLRTFN